MTIDERFDRIARLNEETSRAIAENARVTAEHSKQLAIDGHHINQLAKLAAEMSDAVKRVANSLDHLIETVAQHESRIHRIDERP